MVSWNATDNELRNTGTLDIFNAGIKNKTTSTCQLLCYYPRGNRYLSVLHTRPRNKCTKLNGDLFHSNLWVEPLYYRSNVSEGMLVISIFTVMNMRLNEQSYFNCTRNLRPPPAHASLPTSPHPARPPHPALAVNLLLFGTDDMIYPVLIHIILLSRFVNGFETIFFEKN